MFAAILDAERGASFTMRADVLATTEQFYFPDSNILITRFSTADGVGEVQDFMPVAEDPRDTEPHRLIRRVVCVRGAIPYTAAIVPRFNYGREAHQLHLQDQHAAFAAHSLSLALAATVPLEPMGPEGRTCRLGSCCAEESARPSSSRRPPGRRARPTAPLPRRQSCSGARSGSGAAG